MSVLNDALLGLRELISSGEFGVGDRLPSQPILCKRLGVSPSSLREAVRMLGALGVIESRHGSGVYVSDLSPEKLIGSLSFTVGLLPLDGVLDMYEMRRVLESHVASKAAAADNPELKEALVSLTQEMKSEPDSALASGLDSAYHDLIAQLAGNESIRAFLSLIRVRNRGYHRLFDVAGGEAMRAESEAGHSQITSAIVAGDSLAAGNAAAHHVLLTEQWLRQHRPESRPTDIDGSLLFLDA